MLALSPRNYMSGLCAPEHMRASQTHLDGTDASPGCTQADIYKYTYTPVCSYVNTVVVAYPRKQAKGRAQLAQTEKTPLYIYSQVADSNLYIR